MFNNRIYGLTKGQYSPTSEHGKRTRSSPYGVIDHPFNPVTIALGAEGTFIARTMDRDPKHLQEMISRAAKHKGTSYIDVLQNCNIFNDGAFDEYSDKAKRPETTIYLEHGKPLVFGKEEDKGIKLDGFRPRVVKLSEYSKDDLLVHDEKSKELAFILSEMADSPELPMPFGVFLAVDRPTYDGEMEQQIRSVIAKQSEGKLEELFAEGRTWEIGGNGSN
jgi:2-oxoglutarate ferredoxin oxidoreductase subunit beta